MVDGCDLGSNLGRYDMIKDNLFVLGWARVQRMLQGNISSEQLLCGREMCSILLLTLVARCLETIYLCIWRIFVLCLLW